MPAEMLVQLLKRPYPQIPTQPLVPVWDSESCIRVLQFAPEGREEWRLEVLNKNTISHVPLLPDLRRGEGVSYAQLYRS